MSKLVLYFRQMENIHLKKDVGLFPIYLQKYFDEVEIVYFPLTTFEPLSEEYGGIKLKALKVVKKYYDKIPLRIFQHILFKRVIVKYLKNSKATHFMTFHYSTEHLDIINAIKNAIPSMKVYLKLDCSPKTLKKIVQNYVQTHDRIKGMLYNLKEIGIQNIDLITTETKNTFEIAQNCEKLASKTFLAYNGYDDCLYVKPDISKKMKTIITVGRLGNAQKNTELLLEIIKSLDLKDWKVKLIGPIEKDFKTNIDSFYSERPDLHEKVFFTGAINDSLQLTKEYQESSIFILTSRHESSALVLMEAAINGCYVLSTEVGIAKDLRYCYLCPRSLPGQQDEEKMLKKFSDKLQELIDNQELCFEKFDERNEFYRNNFLMSEIVAQPYFEQWAE